MKSTKLNELLKKGNFVVPLYLFQLRDKLNITFKEFIFIVYLTNLGEKFIFNLEAVAKNLNMPLEEIMNAVDSLSDKGLIKIEVLKNDKGVIEEYISLNLFYEKVSLLLITEFNNQPDNKKNIYEKIEKEFGRTLAPMEYELIRAWFEKNISEELIIEALRETVVNGVNNLKYMDKILFTWTNNGIKTKGDVEKLQQKHREKKKSNPKLELFDYDWFEEE